MTDTPAEECIAGLIGPVRDPSQREVRAVAATTLFGGFARGGNSGPLGNDNDAALLQGLRSWADVVLVGAGTVTAERYGPASVPLAVLSSTFGLDPGLGIFNGRALILAPEHSLADASLAHPRALLTNAGAEFISTGSGSLPEAIQALHSLGFNRVLCEGGPSVYAAAISADLIDVLHLTLDPSVSGADSPHGLQLNALNDDVQRFVLEAAEVDEDSMLFLRYRRAAGDQRADHKAAG